MALLSFKWLTISLFTFLHPFYVSVTEINHNNKDKTIEITCKIFIDDMEETLRKKYNTAVDLSNEKMAAQNEKLVFDYLSKNLSVAADGKPVTLNFIGYEKDSESVFCYLEAVNISNVKKLDVTNSILQDLTDKQVNIIHVSVLGKRKSYKLDYPSKFASFNF